MPQASDMTLIEDTAQLFHEEPALAALYGFTPEEVQNEADLLAAVLAGLVPDAQARLRIRDLVGEAFAADAGSVAFALEDLVATAERDLSTDAARVLLFAPGYQGLLSYRASHALLMSGRDTAAAAVKAMHLARCHIGVELCLHGRPPSPADRQRCRAGGPFGHLGRY